MKSKQKLTLDKYQENKFLVTIDQRVEKTIGDVWSYRFEIRCHTTAVFNKLRRVERKEGYLKLTHVKQETDEDVKSDNRWRYVIDGYINGSTPFEHSDMVKDLVSIIQ